MSSKKVYVGDLDTESKKKVALAFIKLETRDGDFIFKMAEHLEVTNELHEYLEN